MIYFYSGTPGSGKSLHVAQVIYDELFKRKKNIITNFPLNEKIINKKKKKGKYDYVENVNIDPQFFIDYSKKNHKPGKESQTTVIIDECQIIFNPRSWQEKNRMSWIEFFTQHRKYGYDFILISQFDRLVDRQIRSLFEYEIKHRKVNNFKIGQLFPVQTFICVTYWYGVKERVGSRLFVYKKKYSKLYDSYMDFKKTTSEA